MYIVRGAFVLRVTTKLSCSFQAESIIMCGAVFVFVFVFVLFCFEGEPSIFPGLGFHAPDEAQASAMPRRPPRCCRPLPWELEA